MNSTETSGSTRVLLVTTAAALAMAPPAAAAATGTDATEGLQSEWKE